MPNLLGLTRFLFDFFQPSQFRKPMFLKRLNLLQKFSILSLLSIGILSLTLGYTISSYLTQHMVEEEWTVTAEVVRAHLKKPSLLLLFIDPDLRKKPREFQPLVDRFYNIPIPGILSVKVYDRTGTILWSDDTSLIGRSFPDNKELQEALGGKTVVEITVPEKLKQKYEHEILTPRAEIYIPIFFPGTQNVIGVVEAYKSPIRLFQRIRRGKSLVWSVSLGGGLLLYLSLSLFWIVRSSYRTQLRLEGDVRKYSGELENKINILEELYRISLAMQEPMTLNERLDFILKGVHEVLGLDRINILLPDNEMKMLHCMASVGNIDEPLDRIKVPLDERGGTLALAFQEKREIYWDGSGPVPEGLRLAHPYSEIKAFRSRNFLVLPLISKGRTIGVIGADNKFSQKAISQETIEMLRIFASHAAITIENARLFEKERQKVLESMAIMEIQKEILEELDLERLLSLIIRKASELLKAHSGTVYLYDEAHQVFRPRAWYNMGEWIKGVEIPLGRGVTGTAAFEKRGIIANDYPNSPYAIPAFIEHPIWAAIAQPLIVKDKVIGVITINDANIGRAFTQDDLELLGIFANQASIAIDNARLFNEQQKSAAEWSALYEISTHISSLGNLDRTLYLVLEKARNLIGTDVAYLALNNKKKQEVYMRLSIGMQSQDIQNIRMKYGQGLEGLVAKEGKSMIVVDYESDPRIVHYPHSLARREGIKSIIAVPLSIGKNIIGVLFVGNRNITYFEQKDMGLLAALANNAAIAIENARLFEKELKRSQELYGLIKVGQTVSSTLALEDVLRSIVVLAAQVMNVSRCNLMLLDEKGEYLEWRAFIGLPEEMARIGRTRVSESLAGIVASQGKPLALLDMTSDPRAADRDLARKYGFTSYLGVPIKVKEKTIGVLNIYTKKPYAFSEEEIELLSTFADQASIAIENARLYQELKEYSSSLEEKVRERTMELEEANVKLEKASRHKSEFLANMSHELRTPLNSILGFSEVLLDLKFGDLNEKQAKYVNNILISGNHLLQLINDVLDISKVEAGRMELKPQEFSLAQALEDSLIIIRPQADRKNLSLDLEMEGNISITADPVRFKQIMYNLLSNAVKFTPAGGKVSVIAHLVHGPVGTVETVPTNNCRHEFIRAKIRSQEDVASELVSDEDVADELRRYIHEPSTVNRERHGDFVEISVTDTGIGIKKEDQERVFLPFQQVDGSLARRFEGTGLGLALTRQLVEMHGGRIWVESEGEGKGSKFSFVLPLFT